MYAQSNSEHSLVSLRVKSASLLNTRKHPVSAASVKNSLIITKSNNFDISTIVHSSFITNKYKMDLIEKNIIHGTTTRNPNSSKIQQSRIGITIYYVVCKSYQVLLLLQHYSDININFSIFFLLQLEYCLYFILSKCLKFQNFTKLFA